MDAAARWAAELADWAIPEQVLAAAPEPPYGFPPELFVAPERPADSPSRRLALEALPAEGGRVLDVGCGGGAAALALVPPAAHVTGVDGSAEMLELFAAAAQGRGVGHTEVLGPWPEAAARAGRADVVVAHHVAYNVADLAGFARALSAAADRRVVLELTDTHPWTPTNPLWRTFHGIERPAGPTAALAEEVLHDAGLPVRAEHWRRPPQGTDRATMVALVRRRLCLPAAREAEIDAALPAEYTRVERAVTTLWWEAG